MKKSVLTVGSILILILSAIVFVLVPAMVGSSNPFSKIPYVGKYKNQKITMEPGSEFQNNLSNIVQNLEQQGYQQSRYLLQYAFQQSFANVVQGLAVEDSVKSSGYKPSTSEINQQIVEAFSYSGKFDKTAYQKQSSSSKQSLRKAIKEDAIKTRF